MQKIEYKGQVHQFPDDWDNDKISTALQGWRDGKGEEQQAQEVPEYTPEQQVRLNAQHIRPDIAIDNFDLDQVEEENSKFLPMPSSEELVPMTAPQEQFRANIQKIETGGLDNEWTRTHVKGSGSTAYGSYQITKGLLQLYMRNKAKLFTDAELDAMKELYRRQTIALRIGGSDRRKYARGGGYHAQAKRWARDYGYEDVNTFLDDFDYAGTFGLAEDIEFHYQYENFARKMLQDHLSAAKGDALEAASVWHGGTGWAKSKHRKDTDVYRDKYSALTESQKPVKGKTSAPKSIRKVQGDVGTTEVVDDKPSY